MADGKRHAENLALFYARQHARCQCQHFGYIHRGFFGACNADDCPCQLFVYDVDDTGEAELYRRASPNDPDPEARIVR